MSTFEFATYRVFTDLSRGFYGNVSTVVRIPQHLSDIQLQQIAADMAQPATTFLWRENDQWNVRWFAPDSEIELCGHGSLAAMAFAVDFLKEDTFEVHYTNGVISGGKSSPKSCHMNLKPILLTKKLAIPDYLSQALGVEVLEFYETTNKHLVILKDENSIKNLAPNFELLRSSDIFGYVVTAPGERSDFVSRTFVPHVQQLEDPATGSSHAILMPYWGKRLGKSSLTGYQLSKRGGVFHGEISADRVTLSGEYQKINQGKLTSI